MIEHLFLDAQNVAGAVDEDSSGASGAEPIVLAAEQGRGHHRFHAVEVARKSRLSEEVLVRRLGEALFLHDGDEVFHHLAVEIDLLHVLCARGRFFLRRAGVLGGRRRGVLQKALHQRVVGGLIAGVGQTLRGQQPGQIPLGLSEGVTQRVTQMKGLVHRGLKGAVRELGAGENMGLAHKTRAYGLMHHGVQKDDVAGLKRDDWIEARFQKQLVGQKADAVLTTLQDKRRVAQVFESDAVLPGQWVGDGQGDEQLFVGDGDVSDFGAVSACAQRQVDEAARDSTRLLGGVKLGQAERDAREAAGELVVDFAVDDGTALGAVARRMRSCAPPETSFMVSSIRFFSSSIFWAQSMT